MTIEEVKRQLGCVEACDFQEYAGEMYVFHASGCRVLETGRGHIVFSPSTPSPRMDVLYGYGRVTHHYDKEKANES